MTARAAPPAAPWAVMFMAKSDSSARQTSAGSYQNRSFCAP
jgi:hypothetical protein